LRGVLRVANADRAEGDGRGTALPAATPASR
jgi:hypothetical protein